MQFSARSAAAALLIPAAAIAQVSIGPAVSAPHAGTREAHTRRAQRHAPIVRTLAPTKPVAVPVGSNISGYIEPAPRTTNNPAQWREEQDGRWVHTQEFFSQGAEFLRVRFQESLDERALVTVYDPWTGAAFGPYARHELARTGYWSTIIFGDKIGIEVRMPGTERPDQEPGIVGINHGFVSPRDITRGCVPRDASCEPAWQGPADAVCLLATINPDQSISTFCSGALLNRSSGDNAPMVMTANHCLGSQAAAGPTSYIWFWQTLSCNGTMPNINALPRSDGSLMLKRHSPSDWNLVGLYDPAAATYLLGWSASDWDDGSFAAGIHHPGGALKQISLGTKYGESNGEYCDANMSDCFFAETWDINYTIGFTIGGSSGSPIMSGPGIVRGTLTGGPTNDCTISRYGRFDIAYQNLRYYLQDIASPVYVAIGTGDPENNGSAERGTSPMPFNSVHEATFAVAEGDDVAIGPGDYNERFTVWRPMTLRRAGATGIVRIGD